MAGMLDGIKVLEVANWVAAPSACAMLADLGADVVKIEHPDTGDPVRSINVHSSGVIQYTDGVNTIFQLLNRGKRSLAVDLGSSGGQEIVRKLASHVDILVTNLTPHRQERYELRYEDVSKTNPRIIYLALTGYGTEGPDRDRSGFDYAAFWARSGIMGSLGEPDSPPVQQRPGMGDQTTSLSMTAAVALALYERERSGVGQRIDCSLLNTGLWVIGADVMAALESGRAPEHISRTDVGNPLYNFYQCADGKWIQMVMIESERFWDGFCRAVGLEHIMDDPRFADHALRSQNNRELIRILDGLFLTKPRAEWAKMLDTEYCIWAPVQTLDEVIEDPQVSANEYVDTLDHPEEGEFRILRTPIQFSRTPAQIQGVAPELGEQGDQILLDLGYTWDDIIGLKERNTVR